MELSGPQIVAFARIAADRFSVNKDALCEMDAKAGDGDIGLTMSKGFSAVRDKLVENSDQTDIAAMFRTAALTMMNVVPSTMGTLIAGGFLRVATQAGAENDKTVISLRAVLEGLLEGIESRGKAKVGDKTILDSLSAARDAAAARSYESVVSSAEDAAEATRDMPAVHGRAARYPDGSIGKIDPGAVVGYHIVASLVEAAER